MTGIIPAGVPFALAAATNLLPFVFYRLRSIDARNAIGFSIIPNCTLEEVHTDQMVITSHPVEQNAPIADHVYKMPVSVAMKAAWSNSTLQGLGTEIGNLLFGSDLSGLAPSPSVFGASYIDIIYGRLLSLQTSRAAFDLFTGKRQYKSMIMESIVVRTDARSENSLIADMTCREVIIVSTNTTQTSPANMQNPDANSATQNRGTQNLQTNPATFRAPSFLQ